MALKTTRWDSAEYLKTDEDIAAYLDAVLKEDDPALVTHALGIIARAKGMSQISRKQGWTAKACIRHYLRKETLNLQR